MHMLLPTDGEVNGIADIIEESLGHFPVVQPGLALPELVFILLNFWTEATERKKQLANNNLSTFISLRHFLGGKKPKNCLGVRGCFYIVSLFI